jgi:hypothetical protein
MQSFSPWIAILLLAACAVHAGPREDVEAATRKFLAARSYHVEMRHEGGPLGTTTLEFVAPDRYRLRTPQGSQVIIGDTMYMRMDGRTMQVPLPRGVLTQWRDPAQLDKHRDTLVVEQLGAEAVAGKPARKYRMVNSKPRSESLMWIGADGYPRRIQAIARGQGKATTTTLDYSRFNDPGIRITAP